MERKIVLLELIVLKGNSKEYRRQLCHKKSVNLVRERLARGGDVIGSSISEIEPTSNG